MLNANFNYLGIVLGSIGAISYCVAIVRGNASPNRVTWALWALAPLTAFVGALDEGVGLQSILSLTTGLGPACILAVSFISSKGYWNVTRFDLVCGALSLCGLAVWALTQDGNLAIIAAIASDALAGVPTLRKAFLDPKSESAAAFWLGAVNATVVLLTVKNWDFATAAFPIYILAICLTLGGLVSFRFGDRIRPSKAEVVAS